MAPETSTTDQSLKDLSSYQSPYPKFRGWALIATPLGPSMTASPTTQSYPNRKSQRRLRIGRFCGDFRWYQFAAVRLLHPMACPSTNSEVQDLFAKLLEKRFDTQEEAQKSAEILKARYPLLQVKVYDALSSGITCTKPAGSRPAGFALAYCCSLPWACIRRTAKASRSEIESFDRSRGRRNHLHKYIRFCHRQRTALSATDKRRAICCGIELCTRGMSG